MKRTLKELEMSISGITSEEWDRQAAEAQKIRAEIRAEYERQQLEKYDRGELVIGCVEKEDFKFCRLNGGDHYARNTPYHTWPEYARDNRGGW